MDKTLLELDNEKQELEFKEMATKELLSDYRMKELKLEENQR